MLTPPELKITISTLSKRRAWLQQSLDDQNLDARVKSEHAESCKLIDGAMQKLAHMAGSALVSRQAEDGQASLAKLPAQVKILVADDSSESATLMMELLADLGYRDMDLATNGKEAFDKIKAAKTPYDLILCDWNMPELTGLEVHSKAMASNTLRGAHFMMVTAVSEAARIKLAIQQGIKDYIVKPIDAETLEGKIKLALARETQQ